MRALDAEGFTSVVAIEVERIYARDLLVGEHITAYFTIDAISPINETPFGQGRVVTLLKHYCDQDGEMVCEERARLLRFRP